MEREKISTKHLLAANDNFCHGIRPLTSEEKAFYRREAIRIMNKTDFTTFK
ncbi:hypothetical protein FDI40_gp130 [Agrobacterium phage Atu_ph07]|uniref:Uncharacterized protein n=1 Tax=Agrobacterium phage Atu_ph07 TaxID=2024264 RepID=A0A2L0UZE5_9CAUD|nr:hypothetical protein FDI40_gp130 [Agrobacterium phage Atu_ph07]AUZ94922.1 hypothetical protein [Agrobacterium phage Atu_ph07]